MESGENDIVDTFKCITAENSHNEKSQQETMKVLFLVYCASLVFLMQAGFAMICSGCVRKKNVQNTILKNLLDVCGSSIAFFFVGYAFAYGGDPDTNSFIGNSNFLLMDTAANDTDGLGYAHWLFQFAFAATSATIVAGTLAERCQMNAYLMYSMILTGLVYPVIVHNIWSSSGFLSNINSKPLLGVGMIDFAGSGVVHVTGGTTALIATIILGPRKGRFYDETGAKLEKPKVFPGHSKTLQMLGTMILWFGWYGFNAGSAIKLGSDVNPVVIARSVVNTTLAGATSGIVALMCNFIYSERKTGEPVYKLSAAMNGCLCGLAAITGCCGIIEPWASIAIGSIAGLLYLGTCFILDKLCIDDAVDAIPVHFAGGAWGVFATGLFASPTGLNQLYGNNNSIHVGWFYSLGRGSGDFALMSCQIIGFCCIIFWVVAVMTPFFFVLNYMGMLRSDALEEIVGLDVSYHGYSPSNLREEVPRDLIRAYYQQHRPQYDLATRDDEEKDTDNVDRIE